jgi:hypothetical protein
VKKITQLKWIKKNLNQNLIQKPTSQQNQVSSLKAMSIFKTKRKLKLISLLLINVQESIRIILKKVRKMDYYKSLILINIKIR